MQLKVIEVGNNSPVAVETAFNEFTEGKTFDYLQISKVVEASPPKISVKLYVVYELNTNADHEVNNEVNDE